MKIIVDTNIVFSSILNTNSKHADLLLNSENVFEFYSVSYLKEELENHKLRLSEISTLLEAEIDLIRTQIYNRIQFISEELIPFEIWKRAANFVREVDMDDIAFVALSLHMEDVPIWTGDKKLKEGINSRGFKTVLSTSQLLNIRKELEKESR